jgi:hypothetical protein
MSQSKERGETLVISRAQVIYSLMKKAVPKNRVMPIRRMAARVFDYWQKNSDKIYASEPFLQYYGDGFLDGCETWIRGHIAYIQAEAAKDGHALVRARKGGKFGGFVLTRSEKKIEAAMEQRQKAISTYIEHHNELAETLNSNTRYQLRFPFFPDGLLLPSGDKR